MFFECDWAKLFARTLYSDNRTIRDISKELFYCAAERKDNNEMADENTLLEMALRVLSRKNVKHFRSINFCLSIYFKKKNNFPGRLTR